MKDTTIRQSFLGERSDEILDGSVVGAVGLGGAGSHIVQQLSHVGVGTLILVDPDRAELSNLNRLVGATRRDGEAARLKTRIAQRVAKSVNPHVRLRLHSTPWNEAMDDLRDADIIVGCIDSYSERAQLEAFARRFLIPYLDIGMDVHEIGDHHVVAGQVALSMPGDVCLFCMAVITESDLAKEAARYGAAGGRPQVVWPNGLLASAAVGLLVELLTPWFPSHVMSTLLRYDGNNQSLGVDNWFKLQDQRRCKHYPLADVGDPHPFWHPSGEALRSRRPRRIG